MAIMIENESAYNAAIRVKIRTGARNKWVAAIGEDNVYAIQTYIRLRMRNEQSKADFWHRLQSSIDTYGRLTDVQSGMVLAAITKAELAEEARLLAHRQASGYYVGTVGQRSEFKATVSFVSSYQTEYGSVFVYGFKDTQDNIIIAKVTRRLPCLRGDTVSFTAYVKAHSERDGVKQTIVNRIKIQ